MTAGERAQNKMDKPDTDVMKTHAGPDLSNKSSAMKIIDELNTLYKMTGCFSNVIILDRLLVQWLSTGFVSEADCVLVKVKWCVAKYSVPHSEFVLCISAIQVNTHSSEHTQ